MYHAVMKNDTDDKRLQLEKYDTNQTFLDGVVSISAVVPKTFSPVRPSP